ncbi:VOC family protein [Paramicrobacterium agarici]|uniref:PhnB protein n=1 Tax=Paramicrobacterium agarici TaxID=630514 RepID=A0A2A9DX93_9MICO|nr:VOC family protein [Microbacterium agarici]PFG30550.1 PhnB protein [Microbacterium agarici]TQO23571.1 PhnB protein [Microbacterium agarici]
MSLTTAPYISFPGTTSEAMAFYQSIFGGELEVLSYEGMPTEGFPVKPGPDAVAHASLTGGALDLRAGDSIGDDLPSPRSSVYSILAMVDTASDGDDLIARFTDAGGTIEMPFLPAPWGDTYGEVRDHFGVMWQVLSPGTA